MDTTVTLTPDPCGRTLFNHEVEERALRFLDPGRSWPRLDFHGRNGHTRRGVLVELGQIALLCGDEACRAIAQALGTEPTPRTTREAAAQLRRYRLGTPEPSRRRPPTTSISPSTLRSARYVEQQPNIRVRVLEATIQKFAVELGDLVDVLRAFG